MFVTENKPSNGFMTAYDLHIVNASIDHNGTYVCVRDEIMFGRKVRYYLTYMLEIVGKHHALYHNLKKNEIVN